MRRVSKKQKRVRARSNTDRTTSRSKKKLRSKALHLLLDHEHFNDRVAAEKLRQFPNVPRKKQSPFPQDVKVGFVGHYKGGEFEIQSREAFIQDFEANAENSWYLREDKRGNRQPRREDAGMFETNAAMSTGLSRVLADLVRDGQVDYVKNTCALAAKAGMTVLSKNTGYLPGYLSLHPDAEGSMSAHYGAWTVDPLKRELLGISATGKRGRNGPKNLGDCFISILRHDRAIGLPPELTRMAKDNLGKRNLLDWAIGEEMDRVIREELGKLPNGQELRNRADEYQREAAEDWLRRYRGSKAGVDKTYEKLEAAKKRIAELEAARSREAHFDRSKKKLHSLGLGITGVRKLFSTLGTILKAIVLYAIKAHRASPVIRISYAKPAWLNKNADSIKPSDSHKTTSRERRRPDTLAMKSEITVPNQETRRVTEKPVIQTRDNHAQTEKIISADKPSRKEINETNM